MLSCCAAFFLLSSDCPGREVIGTSEQAAWAGLLKEKSYRAALAAVERLTDLLSDPASANGDALKAATLIFEKVCPLPATNGGGGDFEICVRED